MSLSNLFNSLRHPREGLHLHPLPLALIRAATSRATSRSGFVASHCCSLSVRCRTRSAPRHVLRPYRPHTTASSCSCFTQWLLWFTVQVQPGGRVASEHHDQTRIALCSRSCSSSSIAGCRRARTTLSLFLSPRHRHRPQAVGVSEFGHRHHARCRRHFAARAGIRRSFGPSTKGNAGLAFLGQLLMASNIEIHPADSLVSDCRAQSGPHDGPGITTLDVSMVVPQFAASVPHRLHVPAQAVDRWEGAIFLAIYAAYIWY